MTKTASYASLSDAEKVTTLESRVESLEQQLDWFRRQLFGRKSEKRLVEDTAHQPQLDGFAATDAHGDDRPTRKVGEHRRRVGKKRGDDCVSDSGLRFSDDTPVEEIRVPVPELEGPDAAQYEVVREEVNHRLAQRPGSYVVLRYVTPVVKHIGTQALRTPARPPALWPGAIADVSVVAGLLVDKFVYHEPLYRLHQRLQREGITLSRQTLTHWVHRGIDLLVPIVDALLESVLRSENLAVDETPCKVGRDRNNKGKMRIGWYWPIYGDNDEIVFTFSPSRGHQHLMKMLDGFEGTVLCDGYSAYETFVRKCAGVVRAQCWTHLRREFLKVEKAEPQAVAEVLDILGALYVIEKQIRTENLTGDKKLAFRTEHATPVVDAFFDWCRECVHQRMDLVPSDPLSKALKYAMSREDALRVFLGDPGVAIDTNHLERELRVIPMGKKNWLFSWTEVGAEKVGIIQSLMATCRLHGVHPYHYLVDVLQRVGEHPASAAADLTPRNWKRLFAADPMRSDLYRATCQ